MTSRWSFPTNGIVVLVNISQIAQKLPPQLSLHVDGMPPTEAAASTHLKEYLRRICAESQGFLSCGDDKAGQSFLFDVDQAKLLLKKQAIEHFIQDRLGLASARIYRLLQMKLVLEEKQISKMAMIGLKETREKLFQLFSYGFIQLQEVPRTPDHVAIRTIYLWRHDMTSVLRLVTCMVLKSYINCVERAKFERSQHAYILSKAEHCTYEDAQRDPLVIFNDHEKKLFTHVMKRLDRLEFTSQSLVPFLVTLDS